MQVNLDGQATTLRHLKTQALPHFPSMRMNSLPLSRPLNFFTFKQAHKKRDARPVVLKLLFSVLWSSSVNGNTGSSAGLSHPLLISRVHPLVVDASAQSYHLCVFREEVFDSPKTEWTLVCDTKALITLINFFKLCINLRNCCEKQTNINSITLGIYL